MICLRLCLGCVFVFFVLLLFHFIGLFLIWFVSPEAIKDLVSMGTRVEFMVGVNG